MQTEHCHSEAVTDVTAVGIRISQMDKRIAAPVCELARNDRVFS